MKKVIAMLLALVMVFSLAACGGSTGGDGAASSDASGAAEGGEAAGGAGNVYVFYYTFSDTYISSVRTALDAALTEAGVNFTDLDGNNTQMTQTEQVKTAITNGATALIVNIVETGSDDAAMEIVEAARGADIPLVFFNREVSNDVVNSYEKCAFVGTDAAEAGHMQGEMIATYLTENYEATDLNGDGEISYVLFKGQEGNAEAEYRTQYSVEDADAILTGAGKAALKFYDANNSNKYLVDTTGGWSAAAATDYMNTIFSEYSESNNNMVELVICNNDGMAEGAISALQGQGYNLGDGGKTIPVFGVDATDAAKQLIADGKMAGTIKQDAEGMANALCLLAQNAVSGSELLAGTDGMNIDSDCAKIRIPYGIYTGEE